MNMHVTGKTALVVDDEFLIAAMIEDILARQGIQVLLATQEGEAADFLRDRKVDFAFLDYRLHSSSSEQLWSQLQAKGIPFAFCTGSAPDEMQVRFPGVMVIGKPFSETSIVDAARSLTTVR